MIQDGFAHEDALLQGVMTRRVLGWMIDVVLIGIVMAVLWTVLFTFGLMTLGLGLPLLGLLPVVPFAYHTLFLAGAGATPGQALLGLVVVRDSDFGRPGLPRAAISTLVLYVTLATSGLLLLVALVTSGHRTLHDLLSGLVVVRARALAGGSGTGGSGTGGAGAWTMRDGPVAP